MNGVLALADVILSRPQVLCALALGCLLVLGLALLSPSIEYVQLVTGAGISQLSDVERNVAGVLMAAAVARIALAVGRSLTSGRDAGTARTTAPRVPGTAAREHAAR